ncbi:MAG TPA: OsmC family protein [Acidimicrobiales bacterium]|nr:OsmC family protein [Acidimicrobiales bacterium]
MDTQELKALQAPLKQRYREDPHAALITLHAKGSLSDGISCSVETGQALTRAGLHPATGGDGFAACSGDMLLQALVACAGVTLSSVATARGIELRDGTVHADGDLDFRGTLGIDREAPVGFRDIRLRFELDTDASDEQITELLATTERYCVVLQTLRNSPPVETSVSRG